MRDRAQTVIVGAGIVGAAAAYHLAELGVTDVLVVDQGPLFATGIFLLVGMLSFDSLWWALLPPALYFAIHLVEGETLTPMLLVRRFTLNPVLVILSLVFWFWMWGVPGAVLAVPLLAILKIVCDRVRSLKALGHFLEG